MSSFEDVDMREGKEPDTWRPEKRPPRSKYTKEGSVRTKTFTCPHEIVAELNKIISNIPSNLDYPYEIVCLDAEEDYQEIMKPLDKTCPRFHFLDHENLCTTTACTPTAYFGVAAIEKETGDIVSYNLFSRETTWIRWVDPRPEAVIIHYTCTHPDHRRRYASYILNLVPILYAIENAIQYVGVEAASPANVFLMENKLYFKPVGDEGRDINLEITHFLDLDGEVAGDYVRSSPNGGYEPIMKPAKETIEEQVGKLGDLLTRKMEWIETEEDADWWRQFTGRMKL